ncbi:MFS transporter, partial [Pseudomonas aeruginosa]|nr:MFS transporter [Pseudomonas aeruginosa]
PIALAIGVPLGTWLGTLFDWRGVFWIMSALSLLLSAWVRLAVPDFAGQSAGQRLPIRRVFTMPGIRPVQLVLFGVASIAGIWFTGLLVDRCLRALTLSSLA